MARGKEETIVDGWPLATMPRRLVVTPFHPSAFIPHPLFYDTPARGLDKLDQRLYLGDVLDVLFNSFQSLRSI